jgi:Zn-dependent protease with chaperone function
MEDYYRVSVSPGLKKAIYDIHTNDPVYKELIFQDSSLSFMNPLLKGEEAFFGDNNSWKLGAISQIGLLRELYVQIKAEDITEQQRKSLETELKKQCNSFEKIMEREFNIEKAYVGLFVEANAFAVPLCWDKNLVKVDEKTNKRTVNNDFRISLEDIVETSNGFRYKDPKQKIFIVGLGLGLFDEGFSDSEIAAVITHEIGHSFQQLLVGVNTNLASSYISQSISAIYMLLSPILTIGTLGIGTVLGLISAGALSNEMKEDPEEVGARIIKGSIGSNREDYNRETMGKDIKGYTDNNLKRVKKEPKKGFWTFVGKFFIGIFVGIFLTGKYILYPFGLVVGFIKNIFLMGNLEFLRKNTRFEQFADMFAANYGMGKDLAAALAKLGAKYHKIDLATLNFMVYVPVINVVLNLGYYSEQFINGILDGYPDTRQRISGLYKTCKWELANNKELSPKDKKELEAHIDELQKVYDEYVFSTDSKNWVYRFWAKVTKQTIEKDDSNIEQNVLQVLKDMKDEKKFSKKELAKDSDDDDGIEISTPALIAGMKACVTHLQTGIMGTIANLFKNEVSTL